MASTSKPLFPESNESQETSKENHYRNNINLVPKDYQIDHHPERAVADFVSGMTDRFAINLYESLKK